MCGNGVMIGLEIIAVLHSIIRMVLRLATAVCCVGAVGSAMRVIVECRSVTTAIRATMSVATVCASLSVYSNQFESIGFPTF